MIDCGHYSSEIQYHVEKNLEKHIDLLIVTHIDNDHLDGLVEMLDITPDIVIDKILYNCNQLWDGRSARAQSESISHDIEIIRRNLPQSRKELFGKVKADKAITLAESIAMKEIWWEAWKKDKYVTSSTEPLLVDEVDQRFGKLIFLTPIKDSIEKLNYLFKAEQVRLTKHIIENSGYLDGQEALFELVQRVVAVKRNNYRIDEPEKAGAGMLGETSIIKAHEFKPQSVSDENTASIAFVWEFENKRVLFMGDAEPDEVADALDRVYGNQSLVFEAIKVSHHGSKHSTSDRLLHYIDSDHYFFTGGNRKDKPSLEAIIKIVDRGDDKVRILHMNNHVNEVVECLNSEEGKAIREKYHFGISYINEHSFEY